MRVRNHTNPFNYYERMSKVNFADHLPGYTGSFDFEIGFGRGLFLRHYAEKYPDRHIVGVEVRKQIVDILQERVEALKLKNTYLIHGNAQLCLEDMIEPGQLDRVFIFHPDPWFKKRHRNRRVVNTTLLDELVKKMSVGGTLYISTDVGSLWEDMCEEIKPYTHFEKIDDDAFWTEDYLTHWSEFSEQDDRSLHMGAWRLVSKPS